MDIAMPIMGGIEATRQIVKTDPGTKIIVLSQHDNREYILSAIKPAGASGYILKKAVSADLIACIEAVYRSGYYFYPERGQDGSGRLFAATERQAVRRRI